MYRDETITSVFPKTLKIRNEFGGMIWQIYHVDNIGQAEQLSTNATRNGFYDIELCDYDSEYDETFPDWRETGNIKL